LHYCKFLGKLLGQVSALGSPQSVNLLWKKAHTHLRNVDSAPE
jgi:hypothetical protein